MGRKKSAGPSGGCNCKWRNDVRANEAVSSARDSLPSPPSFFSTLFSFSLARPLLCCVTGQSLQGQAGHCVLTSVFIRGLEVLSAQTSSFFLLPFLLPCLFLSKTICPFSDKQPHQRPGLSSVNTGLLDMIHQ